MTSKFVGILCCVAAVAMAFTDGFANCQNEGPYPVTQCATRAGTPSWFAPTPVDAGIVSATWWLLGAGNRPVFDPTIGVSINPIDGDGFIDFPNPGIWIGVDSGRLTTGPATGDPSGGLDLIDAVSGTGTPLAAGGLCFSAQANWALPFVDGCSDQNRTYSALGGGVNASDDYIDPYFFATPGVLTDYSLVDAPMGVLLTESTNKYFAVAFFSSTFRNHDPNDIFDKGYDMGAIINGDDNPAAPAGNDNIVPWQVIPQPQFSMVVLPNTDRLVDLAWTSIRIVRDDSSRPNTLAMTDVPSGLHVLGTDRNGVNLTGVGIMEQPELVSYQVERKPIVGNDCDANQPWVSAGPPVVSAVSTPGGTFLFTSVTVPIDTCLRLTTRFGRIPSASFLTTPADIATRNRNRAHAQAGNLGDIGYEVSSLSFKVGGLLAGDKPILKRATIEQKTLVVEFETPGEMGIESFQVVAKDRRGATSVVATVECVQCASGLGSDYRVEIPVAAVRTARSVHIVVQPSGTASDELAISRPAPRPGHSGRREAAPQAR